MFEFIKKFLSKDKEITHNKTKKTSSLEKIEEEIAKQKENISQKEDLQSKYTIYKQIVHLLMQKKALQAQSSYVKYAYAIADDFFEDNLYEALNYLESIDSSKLSKEYLYEIYTFKALVFEALEDFTEAANSYKELIKLTSSTKALEDFKEYVKRHKELLEWQKDSKEKIILDDLYTLHEKTDIKDLPKSAASLEKIALSYAASPKSRKLGKRYFKEVLKIYKKLYEHNPKEFSCSYIKVLIDAVELFMFTPLLLKEVQLLLEKPNLCIENRVYLLERLKTLKEKNFVKKSKYYNEIF